jgi:hypothetical protein
LRKILITSLIFFTLFFYGLILSQLNISAIPEELEPANHPGFYDYRGVTNVHTELGIGGGSSQEVIVAAQEAGLDYIFITDLNVFKRQPNIEGYHRKLLAMTAAEYSYLDSRIITYDPRRRNSVESLGQAQVQLADLLSQSGSDADQDLIIMAHPDRASYSWSATYPSGLDGFEIINLKWIWQHAWDESKGSFLWSALIYPFNSQLALLRLYKEPHDELTLWDRLSSQKPFIGMSGSDATSKAIPYGTIRWKFPSYQTFFSLASNHVLLRSELTGEAESDRRKILSGFSSGQFYMCLDMLGNPKGFAAYLLNGDKISSMGSKAKWTPGMKLVVKLPQKPKVPFEIAFLKDGQHIMSSNSLETKYELHGPGVYRVVVRFVVPLTLLDGHRWISWIYTNPFYVH